LKKFLAFTVLIISILLISGCSGQIATPDNSEDKEVAPFVLDNVQSMRLVPEHKFAHMHEFVDLESGKEFELFITALNGCLAELELIDKDDRVKHEVFIQL
jgi:hypothetical protein